jgi:hypothetical protein
MKTMTMRERMLAVVQGREHDRVPFAMYDSMLPPRQAFDLLGHGQIGLIRYRPIYRIEHPNCRWTSEFFMKDETKWQCNVILAAAGHTGRLQIQVSENVPPDVWQTSFPIIVDAIAAFGKP